MCADHTSRRKEQIEARFDVRSAQLDLPPEAWPGYMAPILRGSQEAPGELEVAPTMFGTVPHSTDHKLALRPTRARRQ